MSSCWRNFHHLLCWKLVFWQLPVQPVMKISPKSSQWRFNERDGVSNHQPHQCLLNRLFRCRSQKTSKLRVTGLCEGNSPVTGEFPSQRASNAENVSIWWRHHDDGISVSVATYNGNFPQWLFEETIKTAILYHFTKLRWYKSLERNLKFLLAK